MFSKLSRIIAVVERYWYYIGILAMFTIGLERPSLGLWMKSAGITPYLIALAFFLNGFALSADSLLGSLKQWKVLSTALLITFGIAPLIVFLVRHFIPGGNSIVGEGFQIVSLVPTLFVSAVVLTRIANGNAAVALYLTVASNLLAIVVAPTLVKLTLGTSGANLDLKSTMVSMIFTVLIPTVVGQLARRKWEPWAGRHAKLISTVSQATILLFIITGVSAIPRSIVTASIATTAIIGGVILHAVLIGIGRIAGYVVGVEEPERRALTFCGAQKSFVFNVLLCERIFHGNSTAFGMAILPGIIYYLIVLTTDSVIAQLWSTRTTTEVEVLGTTKVPASARRELRRDSAA